MILQIRTVMAYEWGIEQKEAQGNVVRGWKCSLS